MPDDMPRHPMDRALLKGEVGIRWALVSHAEIQEWLAERDT